MLAALAPVDHPRAQWLAMYVLSQQLHCTGGGGNSDAIPVDDKLTKEEVLEALVGAWSVDYRMESTPHLEYWVLMRTGLVNTAAPLERMDLVKQLDKVGIVEHLITEIVDRKVSQSLAALGWHIPFTVVVCHHLND